MRTVDEGCCAEPTSISSNNAAPATTAAVTRVIVTPRRGKDLSGTSGFYTGASGGTHGRRLATEHLVVRSSTNLRHATRIAPREHSGRVSRTQGRRRPVGRPSLVSAGVPGSVARLLGG